jgi:hypothetical protein
MDTMPIWRRFWQGVIPILDRLRGTGIAALPVAYATHVHVHKIRLGVITDASAMQRKCGIAQVRRIDSGHTDVNRLRFHMQTVNGHPVSMRAQKLVAPGCAIAANNVNLTVGTAQFRVEVVEQIENPRIVSPNCASSVIAQVFIESNQRRRDVVISAAINNIETFSGMGVEKVQSIFWLRRNRGNASASKARDEESKRKQARYQRTCFQSALQRFMH